MDREREPTRLIELEPRLLVLFLFITIPFILVGCLFILGFVRAEMNETVGENLHGAAADTARYLDSYVQHALTHVSVLAATPTLRSAVDLANSRYGMSPDAIRQRLVERDEEWTQNRGATPLALDLVRAPTSEFLREVAQFDTTYREILVTDRQGALVASTNITTDYYQADEAWWQRTFGDGELGSLFVSSVTFDASAAAYVLELAVPVTNDLGDGVSEVSGVLKVLVEATDLISVIGAVRRGQYGHALLIDASDGTIIVGTDAGDIMRREYDAMSPLREAASDERTSFVGRSAEGTVWLAGFSPMPDSGVSRDLGWLVVVQQPLDQANAATRAATVYMVVFFVGMILLILAFSLYMHFKLVRPIREIDLREEMERLAET